MLSENILVFGKSKFYLGKSIVHTLSCNILEALTLSDPEEPRPKIKGGLTFDIEKKFLILSIKG